MLCLKCGHDNTDKGPRCKECDEWVGWFRENRGFLPQLEVIQWQISQGELPADQAAERFQRLEGALHFMIHHMDETGSRLVELNLDESQQATLGGFLLPVREGLEAFLDAISQLDPAHAPWPETTWTSLREAHIQIIRGNEGVAFLTNTVAGMAVEAGADLSQLFGGGQQGEVEPANAD